MNTLISESQFEENLIKDFQKNGYTYKNQDEILKLRNWDNTEVILVDIFKQYLVDKYNISDEVYNQILRKLRDLMSGSLHKSNYEFSQYLANGIKIYDKVNEITNTYMIIDSNNFMSNNFIITNQFRMKSNNPNIKDDQYPDMVVYINGLPMSVIELKRPVGDGSNIKNAFNQIGNYQLYLKDLFIFNSINVISNYSNTKFGTITSPFARYSHWRGEDFSNENTLKSLVNKLFDRKTLINYIMNYIFWTEGENNIKIAAGYHQYYSVLDAMNSIDSAQKIKSGKGGVFWHTQGSGKSFSMLFLARNFIKLKPKSTFIFVTDRVDLDTQLFATFNNSYRYLNQKPQKINSINELDDKLKGIQQDGIYFTTVQKFKDHIGLLSDREDIIIVTDEAHRSHNNLDLKLKIEGMNITEQFGSAKYLRDAFINSTFIGFTGTPIEKDDVSTSRVFGKTLKSAYTLKDAVRDEVIVKTLYETRKPDLHLRESELSELDEVVNEKIMDLKEKSSIPKEIAKKIRRIPQKLENFIVDPDRIKGIAADFISHYEQRKGLLKDKAMFVAFNRKAAEMLYNEVLEIRPDYKNHMKMIMTVNNQHDSPELIELLGNKEYRKKMAYEFKNPTSDFKIAIVVDMWLTGFDVPSLDLLYLDKPLRMHNLMQTIARTNRVYHDKNNNVSKQNGLIVDYIGIWKKLKEALEFYSGNNNMVLGNDDESNILELKKAYLKTLNIIYENYLKDIKIDFNKLAINSSYRFEVFDKVYECVKSNNESVQNFITVVKPLSKELREISTVLTQSEKIKFNLLIFISSEIIRIEMANINFSDIKEDILSRMASIIKFSDTVPIENKHVDLSKVIELIRNKDNDESKMSLDIKVAGVRRIINETRKINILLSKKMSDQLKEILQKYDSNYISLKELYAQLYELTDKVEQVNSTIIDSQGYNQREMAFLSILKSNMGTPREAKIINNIMKDLLEIVNNDKYINNTWNYNPASKQKVMAKLSMLMIKNGFPPEESNAKRDQIISQIIYQNGYKG